MIFSDLSNFAQVAMSQLFLTGPTWDGNISSKTGRDELIENELAIRLEGWTTLTQEGVEMATSYDTRAAVKTWKNQAWINKLKTT